MRPSDLTDHDSKGAPGLYKKIEDTVVSLTSVPRRFNTCLPKVIEKLKRQSVHIQIIVNIPLEYEKWKEDVVIPEWLSGDSSVTVYRQTKDYGPATKLIGALEYIKTTNSSNIKYVITVDDDISYDTHHIEKLKTVSDRLPECVITHGGIKLINHPYHSHNGLGYNNDGFVDAPGGFYGVVYPVKPFQDNLHLFEKEFIDTLPPGIRNDDDVFFGIVCGIMNIPIYSCYNNTRLTVEPFDSGGSAVEESIRIPRTQNESELFQFAVEKGYLPNKGGRLFDFIDKVVYINLNECVDRREYMENLTKIFGDKVVRFSAIRHSSDGMIGCGMSHIEVLKMARNNEWKNVLILEDDVEWNKFDIGYPILKSLAEKNDYDVIKLGGSFVYWYPDTYRLHSSRCCHSYLVNSKYISKLLEVMEQGLKDLIASEGRNRDEFAIDMCLIKLFQQDKWYIVAPSLMGQRPSYSQINSKVEDYRWCMNL